MSEDVMGRDIPVCLYQLRREGVSDRPLVVLALTLAYRLPIGRMMD